jgi:two-component system osmolarity sensor histidine kinase EnvZ
VDDALGLLSHRTRGVQISVARGAEVQCTASPRDVEQVLFYVLDAALRAGASRVWIELREEPFFVSLLVADDGQEASDEQLRRLFDPFAPPRGQASHDALGLHLSRRLIESAGGTLLARRRDGGGVEVVMRLARAESPSDPEAWPPGSVTGVHERPQRAAARGALASVDGALKSRPS